MACVQLLHITASGMFSQDQIVSSLFRMHPRIFLFLYFFIHVAHVPWLFRVFSPLHPARAFQIWPHGRPEGLVLPPIAALPRPRREDHVAAGAVG